MAIIAPPKMSSGFVEPELNLMKRGHRARRMALALKFNKLYVHKLGFCAALRSRF